MQRVSYEGGLSRLQPRHYVIIVLVVITALFAVLTIVAWLVIWVGINVIGNHVAFFSRDSLYGVPAKLTELALLYTLSRDKP
jgi:hypothetical protein